MKSTAVKICVVGEWLHGLPDEGIHNLAQNLIDQWQIDNPVSTIRIGPDFPVNRFFISLRLRKMLRDIQPDLVFYISPSSAKGAALFRAKMLKAYAPQAKVLVVASQPASYNRLEKQFLSQIAPDAIFVQSPRSKESLRGMHCLVYFLPSGVDLGRFVPVEPGKKMDLRKQYGVDEKALVFLHVGHIRQSRNVHILANIAQSGNVQVLLVGSTSTPQDEVVTRHLTEHGVRIMRDFIPRIVEIYQLADAYIFPVISEHAAIGVPLSVLEAMACNLPVITTRFGGLPQMFPEGEGLFYFHDEDELSQMLKNIKCLSDCMTRRMVEAYSWDRVAQRVLSLAQGEGDPAWH